MVSCEVGEWWRCGVGCLKVVFLAAFEKSSEQGED